MKRVTLIMFMLIGMLAYSQEKHFKSYEQEVKTFEGFTETQYETYFFTINDSIIKQTNRKRTETLQIHNIDKARTRGDRKSNYTVQVLDGETEIIYECYDSFTCQLGTINFILIERKK